MNRQEFLKKQRGLYDVINDEGNGTSISILTMIFSKILAQCLSNLSEKDFKEYLSFFTEKTLGVHKICKEIIKEFPDDLGCRSHSFDSSEEAKEFFKSKEKVEKESQKSNDEWAKKEDEKEDGVKITIKSNEVN